MATRSGCVACRSPSTSGLADEIERQREALLADIVLLDKAIARTPEGPDLDELLEARVNKYAELDRLHGLES